MDLTLAGKTAVVTGASKGIGLAIVQSLVAEGARVVAGARGSSTELTELARTHDVLPVSVDLAEPAGSEELIQQAVTTFGRLDILVNNVGAAPPRLTGFLEITDADWERTLNLNLLSAVRTTRAALPHLLEQEASAIVTISSVNAFLPDPGVLDYSAAKGALSNFSKSLSKEFGPRGVRVNTVSPGPVETDLWLADDGVAAEVARATGSTADAVAKQAAEQASTGRFTRPHEVADLVLLLASGRIGNLNGSDFVIDGGLIKTL